MNESNATIITGVALLTIFIVKDNGSYMAKCPELDLVSEMDTKEDALEAMIGMIMEYTTIKHVRRFIFLALTERIINLILMPYWLAMMDRN